MKKLFLALMLVFGFGLNVYASNNTPESVITSFLEAVRNGDEAKARTYLDKDSFVKPKNIMKPNLGTKDFTKRDLSLITGIFMSGNGGTNWKYEAKKSTININPDNKGVYTYDVAISNSNYDTEKMFYIKIINNSWKITGWI